MAHLLGVAHAAERGNAVRHIDDAAVGSVDRPFGPGLRRLAEEEMIRRYFRSTNALWNFCSAVGLRITDRLEMRCGLMTRVVSPSANESSELRFGARRQE